MKSYNKGFNDFVKELKIDGAEYVDLNNVINISPNMGVNTIVNDKIQMSYDMKFNWYKEALAYLLGYNEVTINRINEHIDLFDRLFEYNFIEYKHSYPKLKLVRSRLIFIRKYLQHRKYLFNSILTKLNRGLLGEELISNILAKQLDSLVISNITLTDDCSGYCECDSIVISPKGIFCLEIKNYGTTGLYRIEVDGTGNWIKVNKNGRYLLDNPIEQNDKHVRILNNILYKKFGTRYNSTGIIVIADSAISVTTQSAIPICNPNTINSVMNTYSKVMLTQDDIREVYNYLLFEDKGTNYFYDLNYSLENNNYINITTFLNTLDLIWTLK